MYRSSRLNTKVLQQNHTTRGTGTCEAPGPCQAGTRDLCYSRRSYISEHYYHRSKLVGMLECKSGTALSVW